MADLAAKRFDAGLEANERGTSTPVVVDNSDTVALPRPRGRPPKVFTEAMRDSVLEAIARGVSVAKACAQSGFGHDYLAKQARLDPDFAAAYAQARVDGAHAVFESTLEIAETAAERLEPPEYTRIRVDARKWYLSKIAPHLYGEKVVHDVNVKHDASPVLADALRLLEDTRRGRVIEHDAD